MIFIKIGVSERGLCNRIIEAFTLNSKLLRQLRVLL